MRPSATLIVITLIAPWSIAQVAPDLKTLDERVGKLERTVLRDPWSPQQTVLARLDAAEKRLDAADRADAASGKAETRQDDDVKRALATLERQARELDQRLDRAEAATHQPDDLRDIKSTLTQLTRSIADLQERVRRLEAVKR